MTLSVTPKKIIGLMLGSVMWKNCLRRRAPSSVAAS